MSYPTICESCEETEIDVEGGSDDSRYANLSEKWLCWGCYESLGSHAATIVQVDEQGDNEPEENVYWNDEYAHDGYGEDVDPTKRWGFTQGYVHTDGWRGYHQISVTDESDWQKISEGWLGWGGGGNMHDVAEQITAGIGFKTIGVSAPTSNVFSQTLDIFALKTEMEEVLTALGLLDEDNGTVTDV